MSAKTYNDGTEEAYMRARQNLALLQVFADAQAHHEKQGVDSELEADAWRAVEAIVMDARTTVERLNELAVEGPRAIGSKDGD